MHQIRDRRRKPRYKTSASATCLRSNRKDMVTHNVRLVDVSESGAQIVSTMVLPVGDVVALRIEGQNGAPLVFRVVRTVRQGDVATMGLELIHGEWSPEFLRRQGHLDEPAIQKPIDDFTPSIWDEDDSDTPSLSSEPATVSHSSSEQETLARSLKSKTAVLALPPKAPGLDRDTESKIRSRLKKSQRLDPKVVFHDGSCMWQVIDRLSGSVLCEFIRRDDAVFHARAREYVDMLLKEVDRLRR